MNAGEILAACQVPGSPPFLVAGGFAVIAHGHPRTTFDLDLAVRRSDHAAWFARFRALNYELFHEQTAFAQFQPRSGGIHVDLLLLNDHTFAMLLEKSISQHWSGTTARMVALDHLVAMKLHALKHGPPHRYMRDLDDVISLLAAHGINLELEPYKNLCVKHGNHELVAIIKRELQRRRGG